MISSPVLHQVGDIISSCVQKLFQVHGTCAMFASKLLSNIKFSKRKLLKANILRHKNFTWSQNMTYGGPQPTHPGVTWVMHTFGANIFLHKVNGKVRKPAQTTWLFPRIWLASSPLVCWSTLNVSINCVHKHSNAPLRSAMLCIWGSWHRRLQCNNGKSFLSSRCLIIGAAYHLVNSALRQIEVIHGRSSTEWDIEVFLARTDLTWVTTIDFGTVTPAGITILTSFANLVTCLSKYTNENVINNVIMTLNLFTIFDANDYLISLFRETTVGQRKTLLQYFFNWMPP